jgi:hypothetical protein
MQFPVSWFPQEIKDKYEPFFKAQSSMFRSIEDYMSYSIQSFSWPAIQVENVTQEFKDNKKTYKGGKTGERYFTKSFSITFKTTDGFLNYFIMLDTFMKYWAWDTENPTFTDDLYLHILDDNGNLRTQLRFEDVVLNGVGALNLSFSSNSMDFQTFDAEFAYKSLYFDNEEIA